MLTLNQIIEYAKAHDIDFDMPLMSLYSSESVELSNVEQVAVSAQGVNLVLIDRNGAYSNNLIETLKLQDTVNSVDITNKTPKWIEYWDKLTGYDNYADSSKINAFYWYASCYKDKTWAKKFLKIHERYSSSTDTYDIFCEYVNTRRCSKTGDKA